MLGLQLSRTTARKMVRHAHLLLEWNEKVNLTRIVDPTGMAVLHFLDSITVFKVISPGTAYSVIDIGSGAGFPGIVLGTVDPSLQITLLDKDPRRIVFLKHLVSRLDLKGIKFANVSLSTFLRDCNGIGFDVAISRAFSSDGAVIDSLHGLLNPSGRVIAMLGPAFTHQLPSVQKFDICDSWEGTLPFLNHSRRIIVFKKKDR